ncbi:hypothetical protein FRX31_010861 [Thalictrum thalictroides]|uniref:Uncharacterized protein n=1 Tax=Thalictrum thalictroides TaxID=46969 RepID=A0A7J6WQB4_THATH|nr:hypothetical protein FRX31_010861 [Thalictrum thalictroides]
MKRRFEQKRYNLRSCEGLKTKKKSSLIYETAVATSRLENKKKQATENVGGTAALADNIKEALGIRLKPLSPKVRWIMDQRPKLLRGSYQSRITMLALGFDDCN